MKRMSNVVILAALVVLVPAAAFAAAGGEHAGPDWKQLGSQTINFLIYLGIIVFLAKKPMANFFAARREEVVAAMNASKVAIEAAETRLAETMEKISTLDAERDAVLSEFRDLGENERRRIVAEAEAEATRIVADAERAAEREARQAKATLEQRMVDLALEQAEQELAQTMTPGKQTQLIDNGIAALAAN